MLTREQEKRVWSALDETKRKFDKEMGYSSDLRKLDMLESYSEHMLYLVKTLLNKA